ncbi:MFS transporter [Streptomyces europaeiscabiei]|uniref:MFS transporter n=1 Tax=Streptomyces europaeiscabiei TaxID=146819 RepID=UPI0029B0ED98|nr:MFS transporter [Streptomyces europaeiscabiei]MDX2758716.1 MFS transporter [Streptomyces europaeiscabiei]MDX2769943.1 MFS transporter [Streptomyces europaeiscabiei]MDX3714102.1 MFS transporter [Streptomyces europaeiscabiei]MDX3845719.1 MFS transporter [Streptomyces europaeiscabiei]
MAGRTGLGRPFRWLLASAAASNAGDGITRTLLPLLVVAHHPDPAAVAGLTAVNMLPWLLFALPAGVLVDRADRRRIVLGSNAVRAAALAGAAFVLAQDRPLGLLYALAFVLGIAETLADTAAPAMLPRLVDERHLERANGRLSATQIVLNETAGPPVAGLLAGLAAAAALATGGALYALAALLLLGLAPLARNGPAPEPGGARSAGVRGGGRGSVLKDIREGVGFVLRHRTLRLTLAASTLYGLVFSATFSMLVLLSDRTLGLSGTGYGLLLAAGSLGAVGGSWLAPRAADRLPTVRLAFWSLVASGAAYVLLGTAPGPVLAGLALAANGVFMMGWNIPVMSLRQRLTPENLQGRVMSVSRLCAWGTMPLGALLGGLLAEVLSVPAVFVVCGTVLAAGALLLLALLRDSPAAPGDTHPRLDPHTDLFDKG